MTRSAARVGPAFGPEMPLFGSHKALPFLISARKSKEQTFQDILLEALIGGEFTLETIASALGNLPDTLPPGYRDLRTFLIELCALATRVDEHLELDPHKGARPLSQADARQLISTVMFDDAAEDARDWLDSEDHESALPEQSISIEIPREETDLPFETSADDGPPAPWLLDEDRPLAPWIEEALAHTSSESELDVLFAGHDTTAPTALPPESGSAAADSAARIDAALFTGPDLVARVEVVDSEALELLEPLEESNAIATLEKLLQYEPVPIDLSIKDEVESASSPEGTSEVVAPDEHLADSAATTAVAATQEDVTTPPAREVQAQLDTVEGLLERLYRAEPVSWSELDPAQAFPSRPGVITRLIQVAETVESWRIEHERLAAEREQVQSSLDELKEVVEDKERYITHQDKLIGERDERILTLQQALGERNDEVVQLKILSLWNYLRFSAMDLRQRLQASIRPRGLLGRRKLPGPVTLKEFIEEFGTLDQIHQSLQGKVPAEDLAVVQKDLDYLRNYIAAFQKLLAQARAARAKEAARKAVAKPQSGSSPAASKGQDASTGPAKADAATEAGSGEGATAGTGPAGQGSTDKEARGASLEAHDGGSDSDGAAPAVAASAPGSDAMTSGNDASATGGVGGSSKPAEDGESSGIAGAGASDPDAANKGDASAPDEKAPLVVPAEGSKRVSRDTQVNQATIGSAP